jgi:hypothetical protein
MIRDDCPFCHHSIEKWHEKDPPGGDLAICDFPGCLCPVTDEDAEEADWLDRVTLPEAKSFKEA